MGNLEMRSPGLENKFEKSNSTLEAQNKRRKILENLDIHPQFLEPLASMLDDINATTEEILNVQNDLEDLNGEIVNINNSRTRQFRSASHMAANDENYSQAA